MAAAKTFDEVLENLADAQESLLDSKQAIVRLLVPFQGMKAERDRKAGWVDDVLDDVEGLVTALREARAAYEKAGVQAEPKTTTATSGGRTRSTAAKSNGNGNGSNGSTKTKPR